MEQASRSDIGCERDNNEDSCSYWEPGGDTELERKGCLAIVADGMGGHEGGQEASRIAVESIEEVYTSGSNDDPQLLLVNGFKLAEQRILEYAVAHPKLQGMGTTATAVALFPTHLYYAHVGDSRLYLVRAGAISRLTRDHSYVGRLVESGVITPEEADGHPQRHILTAALGTGAETAPDVPGGDVSLRPGDILVLCTDGLWSVVADEEIQQTVADRSPADACSALVDLARQRGGPDNITVQVLRID
jgi:serine/threonine protein phosphatase PrpC